MPDLTRVLDALIVPNHPDLTASLSRGDEWLENLTDDGRLAHWCLEWKDAVPIETGWAERHLNEGPDVEISYEDRYTFGTFENLPDALAKLYDRPERAEGLPIELDLNEWALNYRDMANAA